MLGELARYIYTGNETDGDAAFFFWDEVALHHSFATGGHGKDEYFGQPDKLNDMVDGRTAESCNVYNMLKMTRTLFALKPEIKYADFQERALFNHMLASINFNDGQYCYMVPVGRGVTHEYQGNGFTCCVGTGMESHALHGDGIYYSSADRLWINLYAPSTAEWKEAGAKVEMETDFPEGSSATLKITLAVTEGIHAGVAPTLLGRRRFQRRGQRQSRQRFAEAGLLRRNQTHVEEPGTRCRWFCRRRCGRNRSRIIPIASR